MPARWARLREGIGVLKQRPLALDPAAGISGGACSHTATFIPASAASQCRARGMIGHTAKRHAVLGTRGQLNIEDARAHFRVFEEHLVEVAEAKKQDRVWDLLLDVQVLRDER